MRRVDLSSVPLEAAIQEAVTVISQGGVVIYPTETVYGVAVDATNPEAVSRLLSFKARPAGKPVSVLVADKGAAEAVVELNDQARNLYATFLPGPVTVISKEKGTVDPRLVSEFDTLGIRISSHPVAAALAEAYGKPLTATSANASGKARPYSVDLALSGLSANQAALVSLALDAGTLPKNEPSTVIDTTTDVQEVVRAGAGFKDLMPPIESTSPEETAAYAAKLMKGFLHAVREKPVVFALEGEMGAGKTHFAKGIGEALGVKGVVSSPSYIIQNEYDGVADGHPALMLHMDCWRLDAVDPEVLGLSAYLKPGTVAVIEWAGALLPYLSAYPDLVGYRILIEHTGETARRIKVAEL